MDTGDGDWDVGMARESVCGQGDGGSNVRGVND